MYQSALVGVGAGDKGTLSPGGTKGPGLCTDTCEPSNLHTTGRFGPLLGNSAFEGIARQAHAVPTVLDRLFGAAADARHAMGAVAPPNGLAALEVDVGQGARADAHAARAYFRKHGIADYEAPMDCGLDTWIHLKAVIRDDSAAFYLGVGSEPVLQVPQLKLGAGAQGGVGVYVDDGTEAFARNLRIAFDD